MPTWNTNVKSLVRGGKPLQHSIAVCNLLSRSENVLANHQDHHQAIEEPDGPPFTPILLIRFLYKLFQQYKEFELKQRSCGSYGETVGPVFLASRKVARIDDIVAVLRIYAMLPPRIVFSLHGQTSCSALHSLLLAGLTALECPIVK
jgi:hypothetical protein